VIDRLRGLGARQSAAVLGGLGGLALFGVLEVGEVLRTLGVRYLWVLIGVAFGGAIGWVLAGIDNTMLRRQVGAGAGAVVGLITGAMVFRAYRPEFDATSVLVGVVVGTILFGMIGAFRGRSAIHSAILGAAFGWVMGAFGLAEINPLANQAWAIVAAAVPGALLGLWAGWRPISDLLVEDADPSLVVADDADELLAEAVAGGDQTPRLWVFLAPAAAMLAASILIMALGSDQADGVINKIVTTLINVFIAVSASAGLWVGANLLFKQASVNWRRFLATAFGVCGFVLLFVLDGNRLLRELGPRSSVADGIDSLVNIWPPLTMAIAMGLLGILAGKGFASYQGTPALMAPVAMGFAVVGLTIGLTRTDEVAGEFFTTILWWPIIGGLLCAGFGWLLGGEADPVRRMLIGLAGGVGLGALLGASMFRAYRPEFEIVPLIAYTAAGAVLFSLPSLLQGRGLPKTALLGAGLGWLVGAFGAPAFDPLGSQLWAIVAIIVPAAIIGLWIGWRPLADLPGRTKVDERARSWIFLAPALGFILVTLVIPALRTMLLSIKDASSETYVGLSNYGQIFGNELNEESFDFENFSNVLTSRLTLIGVPLLLLGLAIGVILGRRNGYGYQVSGLSATPIGLGTVAVAFAIFTTARGTIINNLWWVFTVTATSACLGLAIAVLADRGRFERVAKSIIFMPMAISFVGASIIWRAVYTARDVRKDQTGVLNALWVGLGRLSTGSGLPTIIVSVLLVALLLAIAAFLINNLRHGRLEGVAPALTVGALLGWFTYRFIGPGVGGFEVRDDGSQVADTVFFVQESPFNSFWLMVILIWIQTGFAMVILSAAIKAVPTEFLEAARVDGATESQIFWRITLPQILPTLGVVVTTTIVVVMKVFDIVKVITNGQFETQVLANQMFSEAFSFRDRGVGSALAIVLFLSVLPVMFYNIRQMQKAQA
jgi:alpha-glucoside transport system permease protein